MSLDPNGARISISVGIAIGLLASFVQSLGLTIQRKSHVLNQQLPLHLQVVEHRRPLWLFGFFIFVSSNLLGSVFQIASLPVVILAPLGAVSLLWNAFFARILLGDEFSPWMIIGTIQIAGGALLIAFFGIVPEPTHTLDDLLRLLRRTSFVVYFSLLSTAILIALITTHLLEFSLWRKVQHEQDQSSERMSPILPTHPSLESTNERTPLIDPKVNVPSRPSTPTPYTCPKHVRTRLLLAISYASASGILSGMCLLFAKSGVELLLLTIGGHNQFWRWEAWVLVLGLISFALLQLWYMHKSLLFADPTIVCPLAFCFYNVSSIVNGLIYFDQVSLLSTLHLLLMTLGMAVLLGGVWLVSFHAGSGRVDVGTWQEGDDELTAEEEEIVTAYGSTDRTLRAPPSVPLDTTYSEPVVTSPIFRAPSVEEIEQPAVTSPETSTISHRRASKRHRHSFLQPIDSPSSSSTLNLPGGGFSIGLSPVSPGFAIVPKRRTSGFRDIVRRAAMRRTVSDGDVGHNDDDPRHEERDLHNEVHDVEQARTGHVKGGRWTWVRHFFLG